MRSMRFARPVLMMVAVFLVYNMAVALEPAKEQLAENFDSTWSEERWTFSNGGEFPGAKGSFERLEEAAHADKFGGRLNFNFTGGGNYVAAILKLTNAPDIKGVRLWLKNPSGNQITFRYSDQSGQTLQKIAVLPPYGEWAEVEFECWEWSGHWGGANDGIVHGPPKQIAILVKNTARKEGKLFIDDIRLVEGKPVVPVWNYVAAKFEPAEGWGNRNDGKGARSELNGKTWRYDFTKGDWAGIGPSDYSLPGTVKQIHIRFKGDAAGHTARLRFVTHFMSFERNIGEARPVQGEEGVWEFATQAPPGEGWKWYGGENDGKLHGPLRIAGFLLDCNGRRNAAELELLDIRVAAECSPRHLLTMTAECRTQEKGNDFVATLRSLSDQVLQGELKCTIRNWAGKTIEESTRPVSVPAGEVPLAVVVPRPKGDHNFLEAEFSVTVPGQDILPIQAYSMAPVEPAENAASLDPASPFGMGLYLYRYGNHAKSLEEMERAAKMGADAGVKWSREEFGWGRLEPEKGRFDWSFYDKMVASAKRNGISVYGLLSYWPGWTKPYTAEGIDDYCRYAAAVTEHYKNDIQHWEIWNEPNIFFWQGPREMYAELLKRAYEAIKKANPNAQVLGCSTAGIDHGFIKKTMDLGAPFDILTIHPYRWNFDDRVFIGDLKKVADQVKRADGSSRQVWITEMGWATHTAHNSLRMDFPVTTQRRQAELIARAYIDAIASGVAPNISWYDFRNDGNDPFNFENNMGIVTRDFQPKPAYRAYAMMTRMLCGLKPEKELDLGEGVVAFQFAAPGKTPVIALWSISGDRMVGIPSDKPLVMTGLMGDTEKLMSEKGTVNVPLKNAVPVFLRGE